MKGDDSDEDEVEKVVKKEQNKTDKMLKDAKVKTQKDNELPTLGKKKDSEKSDDADKMKKASSSKEVDECIANCKKGK